MTRSITVAPCARTPAAVNAIPLLQIHCYPKIERVVPRQPSGSLLAFSHNLGWYWAINNREALDLTHFLLMYSDVEPIGQDWFEKLATAFDQAQADVMATIIPIEDTRGITRPRSRPPIRGRHTG